jgi:hypothetical protein
VDTIGGVLNVETTDEYGEVHRVEMYYDLLPNEGEELAAKIRGRAAEIIRVAEKNGARFDDSPLQKVSDL